MWYTCDILIFKDKHILNTKTTIKMVARFSVCYSLTACNRATYCCISLKSIERVNLYFFCSSWFCMTWGSVPERKCHHMTPCTSLDNLTRFIAIGTAIMTNVCHLLYHTSTGWEIKMTRECHNFWFCLYSIWKYNLNSCYLKTELETN